MHHAHKNPVETAACTSLAAEVHDPPQSCRHVVPEAGWLLLWGLASWCGLFSGFLGNEEVAEMVELRRGVVPATARGS